jgi:GT2 family glycosyltransferase
MVPLRKRMTTPAADAVALVGEDLAAVLVNFDGWRRTAACARWLVADGLAPERVVVVDNGSGDRSPEMLRRLLPEAHLVFHPDNRGFACGCNTGVAAAIGDGAATVLLVNPDTLAAPGFVARLAGGAGSLTEACVSPEVFSLGESGRVWFAGAWRGRVPGTLVARPAGDVRPDVDYLWACCMLVGRDVWRRVGPFDAAYFLFYEDMDWCERAARCGVRPRIVPEAHLWHAEGGSCDRPGRRRLDGFRRYHRTRSSVLFDRRWGQVLPAVAGWTRLYAAARTAVGLAAAGDRDGLVAHAQGLRDGWRAATTVASNVDIEDADQPSERAREDP